MTNFITFETSGAPGFDDLKNWIVENIKTHRVVAFIPVTDSYDRWLGIMQLKSEVEDGQ